MTPEPSDLVLRDDVAAPDGFDAPVPDRATLLVAQLAGARDDQDDAVGAVVLSGTGPVRRLEGLWVRPDLRRHGLGRAITDLVRARTSDDGASVLRVEVRQTDAAMIALTRGTRVLGSYMTRPAVTDPDLPAGFGWRPMTEAEYGPWLAAQTDAYAAEQLAAYAGDRDRALERSRADFARYLPDGLATPDTSVVVLTVTDQRVGHLWLRHHQSGDETFGFDLEIVPERRGEGWARAAIRLGGRLAVDQGDERLGLHVFGQNSRARNLYDSEGFTVQSTTHDLLAED